jgi:ribonuclease/clavin/mitogillin
VASSPQPKDAAAVILLRPNSDQRNPEVFWVKRSTKLVFLGGFYAFPGGKAEPTDAEAPIKNSADNLDRAAMVSCAAREMFEETGVLLARGADTLTVGQRTSLLDDLESGRMSWPQLLRHYGLHLDASDFTFVGRWVTPPFAPRRFDTWFFLVTGPAKQEPHVAGDAELESGEWISARAAYARWAQNEVLVAPPVLHALKVLGKGLTEDLVDRFLSVPEAHRAPTRQIEFRRNYICFPVRTPTKPPATHTNCYLIYTSREILVIDPGSPYEDEQQALAACVDGLIARGRTVREIVLTHVHPDHVAGVNSLNNHLQTKSARTAPVAAHHLTAESLKNQFPVDRFIEGDEILVIEGEPTIKLRALHTPGHARGHLCFHDSENGVLITGDNVLGFGSVLIDPPEGNMRAYLDSLRRMRSLPNITMLLPGHGPAVANPYEKIDEYIAHRLEREANILKAVREGALTLSEIVARVYTDVSPQAYAMAERAVLAHLEKLEADGLVVRDVGGNYNACQNRER